MPLLRVGERITSAAAIGGLRLASLELLAPSLSRRRWLFFQVAGAHLNQSVGLTRILTIHAASDAALLSSFFETSD